MLDTSRQIYDPAALRQGLSQGLQAVLSRGGLFSKAGRTLLAGKIRRFLLTLFPPAAERLRAAYGISGECHNCGACCQLLLRCPHWNAEALRCAAYAQRPNICRLFPITPKDLKDATYVPGAPECGFRFTRQPITLYQMAKPGPLAARSETPQS